MYFSKRSFLLGLGVGLMVVSLFSVISYGKSGVKTVKEQVELTDEQIIEKATGLGLVPVDENNVKDNLISELNNKVKKLETENVEQINANKELKLNLEETKKSYEKKLADAKKVSSTSSSSSSATTSYRRVTIPSGSSSEKVAKIIYNAGLVDNADKFNKYIQSQGKARKLRAGTFKVPTNSTYSKVLSALLY
ncbi:MAG: endolytic transglycosylase MltG [Clostridia bacterium]|jgi:vacuolar-type H+-ATPase subunit I/STV1|nr:endolytic transglycosylase MltG [Clostridia bacterium]